MVNNEEFAKIFSRNLRSIMYNKEITQAQMSSELKIAKTTISSWMNGKRERLKELYINELITIEEYKRDREQFTREIEALQKKVGRLKELFVDDLITIDEYKTDREKYMDQIDALEKEQAASPEEAAGAVEAMKALSGMDIKAIYGDLTKEERRRFWRGIISTIWIGKDRSIKVDFLGIPTGNK